MNSKALYDAMKAKGIQVGKMCELLNMSRSAFYRKTRGKSEFTLGEIQKICEVLNLSSPIGIFFCSSSVLKDTCRQKKTAAQERKER